MVGNVQEYTTAWFTSVGYANPDSAGSPQHPWPAGYGDDATWNVTSTLVNVSKVPAASLRGGYYALGTDAGVFSMFLLSAPFENGGVAGFRCVMPR